MEIPVFHETTGIKSGTPISAPVLISSTAPASNHFLRLGGIGKSTASQPLDGVSVVDMHREELIVTTSFKPKTPTKPNLRKGEEDPTKPAPQQRSLHARLPSADSGILADGGFDSLSRYRGKTFLSASTADDPTTATEENTPSSSLSSQSCEGKGYSGGQPQRQKLPLVTRVVTLPSKSFFATSSPPASSTTLTRVSSTQARVPTTRPPIPAVRTSVTSPHNATRSRNEPNNHMPSRRAPLAKDALESSPDSSLVHVNSISSNQNTNSYHPISVSNGNFEHSFSSTNQNTDNMKASTNDQNSVIISPSAKVSPNHSVNIAFSKSSVSISQTNHSAPPGTNDKSRTTPSSAQSNFKFQVVNSSARANQPEVNKPRGPGCIALTRPLRIGAPSVVPNVRPVALTSQQQTQPVLTAKSQPPPLPTQPPPLPSQPPKVSNNSSIRVKPKIAPRPSIAIKSTSQPGTPKTSPGKSSAIASCTEIVTSSSSTPSNSGDSNTVTEVPVSYRQTNQNSQSGRVEIPVKHIESNSSQTSVFSLSKSPSMGGGSGSFSRFTPDRQLHPRQSIYDRIASEKDKQHKYPIYENVFNLKDGFSFDDPGVRMKQAELILKQSDELINDALKLISTSPFPSSATSKPAKRNGLYSGILDVPDGERVVEGSDGSSEREHRVPIFDVQSGKLYGGPRASQARGSGVNSSVFGDGKVKDSPWKEDKSKIDAALSKLKTELAGIRDMDNSLIAYFKRCHEAIDALKTQRDVWEGLSEEGEDGEYWDDYEISEFNKKYLDSPGGSESSQLSPMQEGSSISIKVPQLHLPHTSSAHGSNPSARRGSLTQDVEATL